jgi:hypothetical protein
MTRQAAAIAILVCLAACAVARDPMQVYFDNTVLVMQPYGETDRILLNPDHTYVMYGIRVGEGHGRWSTEDGRICLAPEDTPETQGQRFCNVWPGRRVGDHWTIEVNGYTLPMEIASGRQGAPR